jgi:deoxyribose-phosphate aldolase
LIYDLSAYSNRKIITIDNTLARQVLACMDLTSLQEDDTPDRIRDLCEKANRLYSPAAVCVYPQFVHLTSDLLSKKSIGIATVVNFPKGRDPEDWVFSAIQKAIADGATEIDCVFPYLSFIQDPEKHFLPIQHFLKQCKSLMGSKVLLKVILETGAFQNAEVLRNACLCALSAGADFLKTSTGKILEGASLEAAAVILESLKAAERPDLGLKISGGIKTLEQAAEYLELAQAIQGKAWPSPKTFRIGASQLWQSAYDLATQA